MTSFVALTVGDYVHVAPETRSGRRNSEGGNGYILSLSPSIKIKYVIDSGVLSPDVNPNRIRRMTIGQNMGTSNLRRNGRNLIVDSCTTRTTRLIVDSRSRTGRNDLCTDDAINTAYLTSLLLDQKQKAVHLIFEMNKKQTKGWLRNNEIKQQTNNQPLVRTAQLTCEEKEKIVNLTVALRLVCNCAISRMAYAWGITRMTLTRLMSKKLKEGNLKRKVRFDAGLTLFNNEKKREQYINAKSVFKKAKTIENSNQRLDPDHLYSSWMSLSDLNKQRFEELAEEQKKRCETMLEDVGIFLIRTKGRLTWQQLTSSLCGAGVPFVSHVSIANNIMRLPESEYKTTKLFPSLDVATKKRRLEWALNFWVFWESAKLLTSTKVLLVHMDEKWFYAIVVRRNNKFVQFLGMEEKDISHMVQKKQHIRKEMFICTTGYLPHNNDVASGGLSYKITMERVGQMIPAKRNIYRRVYNEDNTAFTYPHIESNILQRKGNLYFESMEVNATKEGSVSNPKCSLLKFFKKLKFPTLNNLPISFHHLTTAELLFGTKWILPVRIPTESLPTTSATNLRSGIGCW